MAKKRASATADDPDTLARESAGSYRTRDGRFEVRDAGGRWFLLDTEQADDFGGALTHGPFGSLAAVRDAIPGARKTTPLRKAGPKRRAPKRAARPSPAAPEPEPSWIDRLPKAEAASVRRTIRALEAEGLVDAEALVRRDRDGLDPAVAGALLVRRLEALADELPAGARAGALLLVERAAEILSTDAAAPAAPLPRWSLVEVRDGEEPRNRRIAIRPRDA